MTNEQNELIKKEIKFLEAMVKDLDNHIRVVERRIKSLIRIRESMRTSDK